MKLFSVLLRKKINVTVKIMEAQYPPFSKIDIENIRTKIAWGGR
jgi:hypothetical protein